LCAATKLIRRDHLHRERTDPKGRLANRPPWICARLLRQGLPGQKASAPTGGEGRMSQDGEHDRPRHGCGGAKLMVTLGLSLRSAPARLARLYQANGHRRSTGSIGAIWDYRVRTRPLSGATRTDRLCWADCSFSRNDGLPGVPVVLRVHGKRVRRGQTAPERLSGLPAIRCREESGQATVCAAQGNTVAQGPMKLTPTPGRSRG